MLVRRGYATGIVALSTFAMCACGGLRDDFEPPSAYVAAEACSVSGVKEHVIDAGIGPNEAIGDQAAFSSIWIAARGTGTSGTDDRCVQTLEFLVDEVGGSVEGLESGWSVLGFLSAQQRQPAVVEFLVSRGADPCLSMSDHLSNFDSPLFVASEPE